MKKYCRCYEVINKYHYDPECLESYGICNGTKERERCSCGGDELKCNFYSYIRERASQDVATAAAAFSSTLDKVNKENHINPTVLMERLIARSIKEEQELPWWVCQEIYSYHNKGE